jgi:hypothetical protein
VRRPVWISSRLTRAGALRGFCYTPCAGARCQPPYAGALTRFAVWHNIGLPQKGPLLASTSPQLSDLLSRYAAQQGHRARGGLNTIAGIDFQLRCYLADFASELARGTHLEDAGAHFLEAFSDYTKAESQRVVCVQVKRTLTKATLGDAADEAVVLDKFFEAEAPDLRGNVLYETVGLLGRSDGSAPDWNGVQLPDKKNEDWQQRQEHFEGMLEAGRFRPPRLVPDPWWRIIAATWQVLDDPFAFAQQAGGSEPRPNLGAPAARGTAGRISSVRPHASGSPRASKDGS